jgi:death on curing protein
MMEYYQDSDQSGVKVPEKFSYMVDRPATTVFGEEQYPSLTEKACCYYHSIVTGHVFHNGNKRTGLLVFETFLNINGYELTMDNQAAEDFTVYIATDEKFRNNDAVYHLVLEIQDFIEKIET